ncbi:MAG: hypothetical protein GY950_00800 [bacterium]|nr:hypothetical protein [bacterium]
MDEEILEQDLATCTLCGEKYDANDKEAHIFHAMTRHPLEAIQTKSFITAVTGISYSLGAKLAERIFK